MSRVFISHSSRNNAHALAVAKWLDANGWSDCFLDFEPARGIASGTRWQDALKQAAHRCEAIVCLISPEWCDSSWCQARYFLAKQLGKAIFATTVEPTPPDKLPAALMSEWQICDLVAGAERQWFERRARSRRAASPEFRSRRRAWSGCAAGSRPRASARPRSPGLPRRIPRGRRIAA